MKFVSGILKALRMASERLHRHGASIQARPDLPVGSISVPMDYVDRARFENISLTELVMEFERACDVLEEQQEDTIPSTEMQRLHRIVRFVAWEAVSRKSERYDFFKVLLNGHLHVRFIAAHHARRIMPVAAARAYWSVTCAAPRSLGRAMANAIYEDMLDNGEVSAYDERLTSQSPYVVS